VCYAAGYPGIPAKSAVTMAIANIVLTVALAPLFGIWGVLSGTALAFTGGSFLQVWLLHKRLHMPLARYWRATLPTARLASVLAAPVVACSVLLNHSDRGLQICAVCVAGISYLVVYTFFANRSGALPESVTNRLSNLGRSPAIAPDVAP
jgi:O-antigen/teichoic acid export membrane protein